MHREGWPASRAKDRQWGTDVICYGLRDASWALYPTPVPSAHGGARNRNNNDWFDYANTRDRFDIYRGLVIQSTLNQGKVRNCWVTGGGLVAWRAGSGMWAWIRYWIINFFCFIDPFIYHSPHMILFLVLFSRLFISVFIYCRYYYPYKYAIMPCDLWTAMYPFHLSRWRNMIQGRRIMAILI